MKIIQHMKWFHPAREDMYDSAIQDAEFIADANKRLAEQRHEVAIKAVEYGIYPSTYAAMQSEREMMVRNSNYKYKHLLYRDD